MLDTSLPITMPGLSDVISDILDKECYITIRCLRSFQLLYWICSGGNDDHGFRYASGIFAAILMVESKQSRRLRSSEKATRIISTKPMQQILQEYGNNHVFYRLLRADPTLLIPSLLPERKSKLLRVSNHQEMRLRLTKTTGKIASHNMASELNSDRSSMTELRKYYYRQSNFIYSCLSEDPDIIDLSKGEASRKDFIHPSQVAQSLKQRIECGRMRDMLARAKAAIDLVDDNLKDELAAAWLDLAPAKLKLDLLSSDELAKIERKPRRSAEETKVANRQKPLVR